MKSYAKILENSPSGDFLKRFAFFPKSLGSIRIMAYISLTMSTLIIHPQDPSTDFLKQIYAKTIQDKTLITGGISKTELQNLIRNHDRIIMLGHGTPNGLLSVGQFPTVGSYIIDSSDSEILSTQTDNVYIWCHSNLFVNEHRLKGFFSGMFISESDETFYCDLWDVDLKVIEESNELFVSAVSKYINEPLHVLYENVIKEYGILEKTNPIAKYNLERLYFYDRKINSSNRLY